MGYLILRKYFCFQSFPPLCGTFLRFQIKGIMMLMKKKRKTIVVLVLFLGLLCYTVFALHALPAAPVEAEFADQIQYE